MKEGASDDKKADSFWGKLNTESEYVAELMKMYQQLVEKEGKIDHLYSYRIAKDWITDASTSIAEAVDGSLRIFFE